jgi:hypothetical protein
MFVLLKHETDDGVHWDFMIAMPDREGLATWRLSENPIDQTERAIAAAPIGDHRRVYLDFEGDIGRGRGSVTRVDRGHSRVTAHDSRQIQLKLFGRRLRGEFRLTTREDAVVELSRVLKRRDPSDSRET